MSDQKQSFWLTPTGFAAMGLIASVTYFLLMEHRQHIVAFLPYLILLLCPLMHVFMHGSHGHAGGDHHNHQEKPESESDAYKRGLEEGRKQSNHHSH
jgi:hypothetical protein